jgi:hypothetical protein
MMRIPCEQRNEGVATLLAYLLICVAAANFLVKFTALGAVLTGR